MVMSGVWLVLVVLIWLMSPFLLVGVVVVVVGCGGRGAVFRVPGRVLIRLGSG